MAAASVGPMTLRLGQPARASPGAEPRPYLPIPALCPGSLPGGPRSSTHHVIPKEVCLGGGGVGILRHTVTALHVSAPLRCVGGLRLVQNVRSEL